MLAAGLVDEVRGVLARGVAPDAAGLDGVGYREVVAMLAAGSRVPTAELREAIARATRGYAKRQETWFRNQLRDGAVWTLDATEEPSVLADVILKRWQSAAAA
jgi:tRNA dimethylallyltransferase